MTPKELRERLASGEDLSGTMYLPKHPLPTDLLNHINLLLKKYNNNN